MKKFKIRINKYILHKFLCYRPDIEWKNHTGYMYFIINNNDEWETWTEFLDPEGSVFYRSVNVKVLTFELLDSRRVKILGKYYVFKSSSCYHSLNESVYENIILNNFRLQTFFAYKYTYFLDMCTSSVRFACAFRAASNNHIQQEVIASRQCGVDASRKGTAKSSCSGIY